MRARAVTAAALGCALVAVSCASAPADPGPARHAAFDAGARVLVQRWDTDVRDGVPAASLTTVRQDLARSPYAHASAASPLWESAGGAALLASLTRRTAAAWDVAMSDASAAAEQVIAQWTGMGAQHGTAVLVADTAASQQWWEQLASATTPLAVDQLAAEWSQWLAGARDAEDATTSLMASVAPYGGIPGLISLTLSTLSAARADHLDAGAVPALLATLRGAAGDGGDTGAAVGALVGPLQALRAVVSEWSHVAAELSYLQGRIGRATAMNTAHAAAFPAECSAISGAFAAAADGPALSAVLGRIATLLSAVNADINAAAAAAAAALAAELRAAGCGHAVPMGRVVVVSLSQQEASFYQNTCLLSSTEVTTGRPGMRTPTGYFRVFSRASPAHFVSGYAPGSPRYYTPETTQYALGYEGGGYYLHDAPWEASNGFGPGSENGPYASHGCIHVPTPVMAWLFAWASIGTIVIVTA